MNRPSLSRFLGVAELCLIIGSAYPVLTAHPNKFMAQAQTTQSVMTIAQLEAILNAEGTNIQGTNFHTALDARYALSADALVAVFVHPLASLDDDYLRSALSQVATLANNFGTSYSSGAPGFGSAESSIGGNTSRHGESLAI